jgi:hypothetical protein
MGWSSRVKTLLLIMSSSEEVHGMRNWGLFSSRVDLEQIAIACTQTCLNDSTLSLLS